VARIFLCHASEDKAQVRVVYHQLKDLGFEPWLDKEDLLPGQDWTREIPRALKNADFILIFFSRTSVAKRGYVQREMKLALDTWQELPKGTIHTIPVRIDACDVPESFRRYQWVDLFNPNGLDRIVRAIRAELSKRPGTEPEPSGSRQQNTYDEQEILALIPYSLTNAVNDQKLERSSETFSFIQDNLSAHKYTRQELDNMAPSQRERLFTAAPEMREWWRGKSIANGAWPLFRVKGGIWLSKEQFGAISSEYSDVIQRIPGLLDWYMEDLVF
jgi:hypothetical protein